jgi:hypothetical protein
MLSGEFLTFDRQAWTEINSKKVYPSGFAYVGKKFIGKDVRIFIKNGE